MEAFMDQLESSDTGVQCAARERTVLSGANSAAWRVSQVWFAGREGRFGTTPARLEHILTICTDQL